VNVALDTKAYRDFMRGDAARVEIVRRARTLSLPQIVLAKLRAGFDASRQTTTNTANLHRFLNTVGGPRA